MGDNIYLGDRDGVRTPMQWSADRNAGFSTGQPAAALPAADHRARVPLRERQRRGPAGQPGVAAVVDAPADRPAQAHRVLGRGDIEFLEPDNPHVLAFVRHLDGEPPMLCVANLSRLAQHVELDLREHQGVVPVEVFGQNRFAPIRDRDYQITLAPYGFFWLSLVGGPTASSPPPACRTCRER